MGARLGGKGKGRERDGGGAINKRLPMWVHSWKGWRGVLTKDHKCRRGSS